MSYQAFYRVYRPQSFTEMSGQEPIKQTLQNALLHQKTTHAYLFSGPRGTGKTSAAKIFAKALNCEKAPAQDPCNECATCLSITKGSNPDVIEFDAASNSRVEEIREIIERVHFAPSNTRYKVYIIDEVHMLSNSAFNALLKTLEEPPAHVVFILATTEAHKLPPTIISRCQRFEFKPLSNEAIVTRMAMIVTQAGIQADRKALHILATAAAGGMRDALSLLDQVVAYAGTEVTVEAAHFVTGSISSDQFHELAQAISEKDPKKALLVIQQLIRDGKDPARLVEDFITYCRDLLLLKTANELAELMSIAQLNEKTSQLATQYTVQQLHEAIQTFSMIQQDMRFSNAASIYIETAILKLVYQTPTSEQNANLSAEITTTITRLEQQVQHLQQQLSARVANVKIPDNPSKRPSPKANFNVPVGKIHEVLNQATKEDITKIKEHWAQMIQSLQRSYAALLQETEPVAASPTTFVLKFKHEIHCKMATEKEQLNAGLGAALATQTGTAYEVVYVPDEQWPQIRADYIAKHKQGQPSMSEEEIGLVESNEESFVVEAKNLFGKEFVEVFDD